MRDEFLLMRHGKQYVLYAGLLDEAHAKGLVGISTWLVQVPAEENNNVAICRAIVDMGDGSLFGGIGDASPKNVGGGIVPHIIRMAETRAKARALRDATNIGAESLEEQGGDDAPAPARQGTTSQRAPAPEDAPNTSRGGAAHGQKARKSQADLLRTLAEELRGENGVARLEERIGKSLEELTRAEADEWIDRLTPNASAGE